VTQILALDTTSKHASIAISTGEEIRMEYNFAAGDELSVSLLPALEFILGGAGLEPADIDVYGITTGPGLFTGIRVGLAALKGILFGMNKPVVAVTALEASAFKCATPGRVISLIDARRNEVYMAGYINRGEGLKEFISPRLVPVDRLRQELPEFHGKVKQPFLFTGSGALVNEAFLGELFPAGEVLHRSLFLAPEVCKIASNRYLSGHYLEDLQLLMPVYIRKPDAEVNYGKAARK
jgi:tRNA threonylcarbamoyladenosine biosynthesis protein TsaB